MEDLFQILVFALEIIGTIAFAASASMLAIDRELDLFGVIFVGIIAAVGGGIMRDLLLGILPPNAFTDSVYVAVAFAASLAVFLFAYLKGKRYWKERRALDHIINLLDAIGLGIFSVVGVQTAITCGHDGNAFLCIFMGMTTGVGGGVVRDLLTQMVPAVLRKRIYAVASILGGGMYYLMMQWGIRAPISMLSGVLLTILIRLLATKFAWDLPKVHRD